MEIAKYLDKAYLNLEQVLNNVLRERSFGKGSRRIPSRSTAPFSRKGARDRALIRVTASIISVFKSHPLSHPVIESFVEITPGRPPGVQTSAAPTSRASLLQPAGYLRWIIIPLVCEGGHQRK